MLVLAALPAHALPTLRGDLDEDGQLTVLDLTRLSNHIKGTHPLSAALALYADINGDGFLNDGDQQELVKLILGTRTPEALPLAAVRESSPFSGESGVALTREVIVRFTMPLSANTTLSTYDVNTQSPGDFHAEAGGRRLLTRCELSGDRTKATLFFLEPVPASTRVTVTFDGVGINDLVGRQIDPAGDNLAASAGILTFNYDTAPITPVPGTGIIGHVYASEPAVGVGGETVDVPLEGVLVRVIGSETLLTHTLADGSFNLTPCPAGRFFVEVDGKKSPSSDFPTGDYYPIVQKAWEAVAGKSDNLAAGTGRIYLPRVHGADFVATSMTENTIVTLPALPGVQLTIPPNNLSDDQNNRGGFVVMAPVAPDRLPEPLPPGLEFPLVITIQTDGATNFDRPVPVKFPNLPDPLSGEKLPPGAKSALWSFNHDTGAWEIAGPMTVSDDGNFVISDVGVGVRQPGWHGTQPGCQAQAQGGTPAPCRDIGKHYGEAVGAGASAGFGAFGAIVEAAGAIARYNGGIVGFMSGAGIGVTAVGCINKFDRECVAKLGLLAAQFYPPTAALATAVSIGWAAIEAVNSFKQLRQAAEKAAQAQQDCLDARVDGAIGPMLRAAPANAAPSPTLQRLSASLDLGEQELAIQPAIWSRLSATLNRINQTMSALNYNDTSYGLSASQKAAFVADTNAWAADVAQLSQRPNLVDLVNESVNAFNDYRKELDAALIEPGARSVRCFVLLKSPNATLRLKTSVDGAFQQPLSPNTTYLMMLVDPLTLSVGSTVFLTGVSGTTAQLPKTVLAPSSQPDSDSDGLPDDVEEIIGTDAGLNDTDLDGVPDGTEVNQGTDPLSGLAVATGVIATVDTPGNAVDVAALNQLVAVADSEAGVSLFSVSSVLNPVRVAQVDTAGTAKSVAISGSRVAVADGTSGLAVIDVTNPANASLAGQFNFGASAEAVAAAGSLACVGLANGQIVVFDMDAGIEVERLNLPNSPVHDVAIAGSILYAVTPGRLYALPLNATPLVVSAGVNFSGGVAGGRRLRVFVGGGLAYVNVSDGYNIFSLADPAAPVFLRRESTAQQGWKQIIGNGSGLGLAAVGVNSTNDGAHDVSIYGLNPGGTATQFLTTFETPGLAEAVAIYNGLGFVADGAAGLSVVNYLAYDTLKVPPTITLATTFPGTSVEEGKFAGLVASVSDDVQVRNVELYVDGELSVTDGNFPFEHRFVAPLRTAGKTTVVLRAKATDTGGNATWAPELTLTLTPDATPPVVKRFIPSNGALTGALRSVTAIFNERIEATSLSNTTLVLTSAGADGVLGTADDQSATPDSLTYLEATDSAVMQFNADLPAALYRIEARSPLRDLAGNVLAASVGATFRVFSFADSDHDGVPDDVEAALGLNPTNDDTDRDGTKDGAEDFDNDKLNNAAEIFLGRNPALRDTDGDGIDDGMKTRISTGWPIGWRSRAAAIRRRSTRMATAVTTPRRSWRARVRCRRPATHSRLPPSSPPI